MRRFLGLFRRRTEVGAVFITLVLVLGFSATTKGVWLSSGNLREVLRVTAILAIMAFGEALVITTGEIDISVGSTFGVVGLIYLALGPQVGAPLALLIALAAAVAIGFINGFVVAYFKISSLVVTLGSLFVFRGLAVAATQSPTFYSANAAMKANPIYQLLGAADFLGYNNVLAWAIVILIFLTYVLFLTPIGNHLLAVGGNRESAHSRGVSILRTKWGAYIACAFLAGLAAIFEASNIGYADGSFGRQRELQAIAAAVLGGCALAGGRSSLIGTLLGAFILSSIQSYLVINAVQPQWFILLLGMIVIVVSLIDRFLSYALIRLIRPKPD